MLLGLGYFSQNLREDFQEMTCPKRKACRRGIGVGVQGAAGRDVICSQKATLQFTKGNAIVPIKSWLASTFPCFSGFPGAAIAQLLRNSLTQLNHCITIVQLLRPFPRPLLLHSQYLSLEECPFVRCRLSNIMILEILSDPL